MQGNLSTHLGNKGDGENQQEIDDMPSMEEYESALQGVEGLPRVSASALTQEQAADVESMYGSNFSLLFLALVYRDRGKKDDMLDLYIQCFTREYGSCWEDFLSENVELVENVKNLVIEKERIDSLMNVYVRLLSAIPSLVKHVQKQATYVYIHELQIALKIRLNPLLRQVDEALLTYGIDVREHFF